MVSGAVVDAGGGWHQWWVVVVGVRDGGWVVLTPTMVSGVVAKVVPIQDPILPLK